MPEQPYSKREIDIITKHITHHFDDFGDRLSGMKDSVDKMEVRVGEQNGRISKNEKRLFVLFILLLVFAFGTDVLPVLVALF